MSQRAESHKLTERLTNKLQAAHEAELQALIEKKPQARAEPAKDTSNQRSVERQSEEESRNHEGFDTGNLGFEGSSERLESVRDPIKQKYRSTKHSELDGVDAGRPQ